MNQSRRVRVRRSQNTNYEAELTIPITVPHMQGSAQVSLLHKDGLSRLSAGAVSGTSMQLTMRRVLACRLEIEGLIAIEVERRARCISSGLSVVSPDANFLPCWLACGLTPSPVWTLMTWCGLLRGRPELCRRVDRGRGCPATRSPQAAASAAWRRALWPRRLPQGPVQTRFPVPGWRREARQPGGLLRWPPDGYLGATEPRPG